MNEAVPSADPSPDKRRITSLADGSRVEQQVHPAEGAGASARTRAWVETDWRMESNWEYSKTEWISESECFFSYFPKYWGGTAEIRGLCYLGSFN